MCFTMFRVRIIMKDGKFSEKMALGNIYHGSFVRYPIQVAKAKEDMIFLGKGELSRDKISSK